MMTAHPQWPHTLADAIAAEIRNGKLTIRERFEMMKRAGLFDG
jgi:hypothetical protein